jgi:hypothetical protein
MMTSNDFNGLNYTQKTETILKGTYLAQSSKDRYYIHLYNVGNFYVEVFYENRSQLITHFRAFENTILVVPYLDMPGIAV